MSLYNDLTQYTEKDYLPLHMPGHKRNPKFSQPEALSTDITELPGFESLYEDAGALFSLKNRIQTLTNSAHSYLLVNGSTGGLLTAIRSATRRGDTVLLARNCHCSVYHAVRMFGLHAEYILPTLDRYQIAEGIRLFEVKEALEQLLQASPTRPSLVILTSPTYEGRISEVKEISAYLHSHRIPLLVDEAHGAHFSLHPAFPESAVAAGADLVVQSFHKTLPTLTQTAVLHSNGSLVSEDRVRQNYKMLQTSSPSFLLLASVDRCITTLETQKDALFSTLRQNLTRFYQKTSALSVLHVVTPEECATPCDASRIVVTTPPFLTGLALCRRLREDYHIELEAAFMNTVIAITGIADEKEVFERFADALLSLDAELMKLSAASPESAMQPRETPSTDSLEAALQTKAASSTGSPEAALQTDGLYTLPECVMDSFEAEGLPTEALSYAKCAEKVSAEFLYLYPPGIPLLVPGERIAPPLIARIEQLLTDGYSLYGPREAKSKRLQVIREQ